jgi:hypothetical protein
VWRVGLSLRLFEWTWRKTRRQLFGRLKYPPGRLQSEAANSGAIPIFDDPSRSFGARIGRRINKQDCAGRGAAFLGHQENEIAGGEDGLEQIPGEAVPGPWIHAKPCRAVLRVCRFRPLGGSRLVDQDRDRSFASLRFVQTLFDQAVAVRNAIVLRDLAATQRTMKSSKSRGYGRRPSRKKSETETSTHFDGTIHNPAWLG